MPSQASVDAREKKKRGLTFQTSLVGSGLHTSAAPWKTWRSFGKRAEAKTAESRGGRRNVTGPNNQFSSRRQAAQTRWRDVGGLTDSPGVVWSTDVARQQSSSLLQLPGKREESGNTEQHCDPSTSEPAWLKQSNNS